MAFHSLKNHFQRRQDRDIHSKGKRKDKKKSDEREKMCSGSWRHQDIGEVQIKNEKRKKALQETGGGVRKE